MKCWSLIKPISVAIAVLLMLILAQPIQAQRRIAVVVDTSGSMQQNDHSRFAVQISKILSDLVEDRDEIAIIRFPSGSGGGLLDLLRSGLPHAGGQNCDVGPDPSLMVKLSGSQLEAYKKQIDSLLQYGGDTVFGAPLRTAEQFLGQDRGTQRLLLLISDAEKGFGDCDAQYTKILQQLGDSGTSVSLVKIGGSADDFAKNPAIQFRKDVQDSANLIGAVAEVYQRFLGSKKVQTGRVSGNITVQVDSHVKDAYLVVAADSALGIMQQAPGNPSSAKVDLDFRSGGQTRIVGATSDQDVRGYRIVHLSDPSPGSYTFRPPPHAAGGWMLLQDYDIALRLLTHSVPADGTTPVQVEVVDERTNTRITDPQTLTELKIFGKIESSIVSLSSTTPGVFTVDHRFGSPGSVAVELRLRDGPLDRKLNESIDVSQATLPPPPPPPPLILSPKPGDIDYGIPAALDFGRLPANSTAISQIHFENAHILTAVDVEVSTDFEKRHVTLQIQTPDGWKTISATPQRFRLAADDPMHWPIRLQLNGCPEACSLGEHHKILFVAHRTDGVDQRAEIPLTAEIIPSPWYICWRREILAFLGLLALCILIHGFMTPFRFGRRIGVQASTVEDLNEGYFFQFRASPGSRSGFYRDSTLYLTEDFRLVTRKAAGLVRLRAFKTQIRIRPENHRTVLRQQADGTWEPLPPGEETIARPGVLFCNEARTIYFDIRTR